MKPATKSGLKRYVEIVRVSTQGQADRDTPEDQRRALESLRKNRPGIFVERIDLAVSGAEDTLKRPDIQRLKTLATAKAFDEVRVRHIDRLTRHEDPAERFVVYGIIAGAEAIIVDAQNRETDPTTELGELDYYIQTMVAARERTRIRDRTMTAKKRKAGEGRLAQGQAPYGRTFDKVTGWGFDPTEKKIYERMIRMCLAGRSLSRIAADLNLAGHITPRGKKWSGVSVCKLLHARTAYGLYTAFGTKAGQPITFKIPPIIDEATFLAVEAKLRANNSKGGPRAAIFALLRKLMVCAECGSPMYVQLGGGTPSKVRYYHCSAHDPACHVYHRVDDVDSKVMTALRGWLDDPQTLEAAAGHKSPEDLRAEAQAEVALIEGELQILKRRQVNTARLVTMESIDADQCATLLEEIRRRRVDAEVRLTEAKARVVGADRQAEVQGGLAAAIASMRKGLQKATPERWRTLCELLFQRGDVRLYANGKVEFRGRVRLHASPVNHTLQSGRR
jgi:DNA invertase Pin-like site-specific DNA recombinase